MEFHDAPKGLAEWLICAACALWIAMLAIDFFRKVKGETPRPGNEQLDARIQSLDDDIHDLKREDAILHTRCTELRSDVSHMKGQMDKMK